MFAMCYTKPTIILSFDQSSESSALYWQGLKDNIFGEYKFNKSEIQENNSFGDTVTYTNTEYINGNHKISIICNYDGVDITRILAINIHGNTYADNLDGDFISIYTINPTEYESIISTYSGSDDMIKIINYMNNTSVFPIELMYAKGGAETYELYKGNINITVK